VRASMGRIRSRRYGLLMVALSALLWSTAGLFVRMAHLDAWSIVAWRSVFSFVTLGTVAVILHRGALPGMLRRLDSYAFLSVAVATLSTISYVVSLRLTTVANVMTVYAALPFVATAIAYLWLGERVTRRFLVAGSIALAGIALSAGGISSLRDLAGILAAIVMTITFAAQLVLAKRHPGTDMVLLTTLASALCVPVALPLMDFAVPGPTSLLACALYGALTTGLAYVLVLEGGRHVTSGEAGFISMLDVALGPLWVWVFYAERPAPVVILGGCIVLGSVLWYLLPGAGLQRLWARKA
jgi:drug/metabolite transporter (DMT)-like permease